FSAVSSLNLSKLNVRSSGRTSTTATSSLTMAAPAVSEPESCARQPVVMLGVARPLLRQVLEPGNCLVIVERTVSAFDIAVAISRVAKNLTDVKQAVCPFYAPLMLQVLIPLRHGVNDNEISPLGSD